LRCEINSYKPFTSKRWKPFSLVFWQPRCGAAACAAGEE
jgi:hypothetical protein